MRSIFTRKKDVEVMINPTLKLKYKNARVIESATDLLNRQSLKLADIRTSLSVNDEIYQKLYVRLFENMANLAQCVPASEQDHHSNLYGYLDHVFECVVLALRYREGYVYRSDREDMIMRKKDVFSYAVTVGALCHDLGKLITDIQFHNLTTDTPHSIIFGPIQEKSEFVYRFYPERKIQDHKAAGLMALSIVVPSEGLQWIQEEDCLYRELLHAIGGDNSMSGKLGEIVLKADRYSTSKNLSKIADKYSLQSNGVPQKYNETCIDNVQQTIAVDNRNSRAIEIIDALMSSLNRHEELANGKKINEKGGFAWVTKKYIYVVTPRCFNIIQGALEAKHSKVKVSQAHICYQILTDAGFIEKVNGKMFDYFTIDSEGWGKSLPLVRFIRTKLDPDLRLTEATFLIENQKEKESDDSEEVTVEKEDIQGVKSKEPQNHSNQPLTIDIGTMLDESSPLSDTQSETAFNDMTVAFFKWLNKALKSKKIDVNKKNAPIHVVDQGMCLVSPVIFDLFITSKEGGVACEKDNLDPLSLSKIQLVKKVQHIFFASGVHLKDIDRKNIVAFSVEGANKKNNSLSGVLLKPEVFHHVFSGTFSNSVNVHLISCVPAQ